MFKRFIFNREQNKQYQDIREEEIVMSKKSQGRYQQEQQILFKAIFPAQVEQQYERGNVQEQ